jgi:hypothetical protein
MELAHEPKQKEQILEGEETHDVVAPHEDVHSSEAALTKLVHDLKLICFDIKHGCHLFGHIDSSTFGVALHAALDTSVYNEKDDSSDNNDESKRTSDRASNNCGLVIIVGTTVRRIGVSKGANSPLHGFAIKAPHRCIHSAGLKVKYRRVGENTLE